MRRKLRVPLTVVGLNRLEAELRREKQSFLDKVFKLDKRLAEYGARVAQARFSRVLYAGDNDVTVHVEKRDRGGYAVVANGEAVLFIEFGTGVKYPDDHPEAASLGMKHGAYGHKLGALERGWRYEGNPGNAGEVIAEGQPHAGMVHTYGNPANRCLYESRKAVEDGFLGMVKEVFSRD